MKIARPRLAGAAERRRAGWMLLAGAAGAVLAAIAVTLYFTDLLKGQPRGTAARAPTISFAPAPEDESYYKGVYEGRLKELEDANKRSVRREAELETQLKKLRSDLTALKEAKDKAAPNPSALPAGESVDGWPPAFEVGAPNAKLPDAPEPVRGLRGGTKRLPAAGVSAAPAERKPRLVITDVGLTPKEEAKKPTEKPQTLTYLPSGSFAKARLLNGAIAPTRGQGSGNPVPLLMELVDDAVMPNLYRSGIKRCFVTANATGELASERVLVRLDRLSCIDEKGGAVDTKLQGYLSGEDGKTGLQARLVTKSGQAIANALFTGTLAGLGKAVSLASEETKTSAFGTVSSSVKNPWRSGIGEGSSHAMDRITDYYLKLASDMFPVLEVDSGRVVEIVLSKGISIERLTNK
jgi:conjugal transfer pilus assembly protein TraB